MLKAVLFDVDGTLAETEEFHRQAFNGAFAEHGMQVAWSADEYRELLKVTGGKERLARYFQGREMAVPEERIRAIHAAKNDRYASGIAAGSAALRPGILRLIREARAAGLKLGIATTTTASNLEVLLRPLLGEAGSDWSALFDCVVAGDQVERKKPAPDVYLACLAQLGIRAQEAVAIEDSPAGVASARAAGIVVLATPSLYTLGQDLSGAQAVVPDLGEPDRPWPSAVPGFAKRWVDLDGLRRLLEIAQGSSTPARQAATGTG
jgi:beta-phosphoglucomutase-like phosphatase (HAD superfamily)